LIVVEFEKFGASDCVALLKIGRPEVVFDLRRVPRFDIEHLNRRLVFNLFAEGRIEYIDLSGRLATLGAIGATAAVSLVVRSPAGRRGLSGPIVLLVDRAQSEDAYISDFVDGMPSAPHGVWDVLKLPLSALKQPDGDRQRDLVFISHANPEDNGFAAWLSGKLAIAGYKVWSDVTKLVGGELFWNDIEEAIRYHATKVIVALSKVSQKKTGVLDEIDLAIRIERSNGFERFVLPLRIDNLPLVEVRANLARKNIIDFNGNWADGLSNLLKTLERDSVPQTVTAGANTLSDSLNGGLRARTRVVWKPETLVANWLPIQRLPDRVDMVDVEAPPDVVRSLPSRFGAPAFSYLRLVGVFGDDGRDDNFEVCGYRAKVTYRVPMAEFMSGAPRDLPGLSRREAWNHLINLVRQAWNASMAQRGLYSFETASATLAWYLPRGLADGDKVGFVDDGGARRRKQLVGWSDRRQVFWHAAFEARPVLAGQARIVLRQHVIFTEDGTTPIGNTARMHALRRSFCRSWWNDRWRDLLLAFVAWLADGARIQLPVGPSEVIFLDPPLRLTSPVIPEVEELFAEDEAEPLDVLDDPEDDIDDLFDEVLDVDTAETRSDDAEP
jgi:hypothetical protein